MFAFRTKAENLEQLISLDPYIHVPKSVHFSRAEWNVDSDRILSEIRNALVGVGIVRSSAHGEDGADESLAGAFESRTGVDLGVSDEVASAINSVFEGMARWRGPVTEDRVLVQELVANVSVAGVIMSRDRTKNSPYVVINYDDISGRTDLVTSGVGELSSRVIYVFRDAQPKLRSRRFRHVFACFLALEKLVGSEFIDVEFALDNSNRFWLLQVRPMPVSLMSAPESAVLTAEQREDLDIAVKGYLQSEVGSYGSLTVLDQMADWNPAEIIGRSPHPLAFDLYAWLVTDSSWAEARFNLGYRDMRGRPLMVAVGGQPYVDVRRSFNSFLPEGTAPSIAQALVDAWVQRVREVPALHDKVEFEVATPSYRFDLHAFYDDNYPGLLSPPEFKEYASLLHRLMLAHVRSPHQSLSAALSRVKRLSIWQEQLSGVPESTYEIFYHLEVCRNLGVVPFAEIARHAFAARTYLSSLEGVGLLPRDFVSNFLGSIDTVATDFAQQLGEAVDSDHLQELMKEFGHLRPGTYDIASLRYDQLPMELFESMVTRRGASSARNRAFWDRVEAVSLVDEALDNVGESVLSGSELINYAETSTIERERAKFIFTRTLSGALEGIAGLAAMHGLDRSNASFLSLDVLNDIRKRVDVRNIGAILREAAARGEHQFHESQSLRLPPLLSQSDDLWVVPFPLTQPNFITQLFVRAPQVSLTGGKDDWYQQVGGKIVLIENADPGFDWIFTQAPAGLVTKFGGMNSHMSIRCAEFGLAAAIGCGEALFEQLKVASIVELDCRAQLVRPCA